MVFHKILDGEDCKKQGTEKQKTDVMLNINSFYIFLNMCIFDKRI